MLARTGLLVLLLLVPAAVQAAQLHVSSQAIAGYDDNVFNDPDATADDFLLTGSVGLVANSTPGGHFDWSLSYRPSYEKHLDEDSLDGWAHVAGASFDYRWGDATTLSGEARFTRTDRTSQRGVGEFDVGAGDIEVSRGENDIDRLSVSLGLERRLGRRWTASGGLDYALVDYEQETRSDFEAAGATASLRYQLSSRQSLGGGVSARWQVVDEAGAQAEQETRFAGLFASWSYAFSRMWSLDLRAGPTFIQSKLEDVTPTARLVPTRFLRFGAFLLEFPIDARTCPRLTEGDLFAAGFDTRLLTRDCLLLLDAVPPSNPDVLLALGDADELGRENDSTTLFAEIGLTGRRERTVWSLRFRRSASENFGGRTSTIANVLTGSMSWVPHRDWRLELSATWAQREQATESRIPVVVVVPAGANQLGLDPRTAITDPRAATDPSRQPLIGEVRTIETDDALDIRNLEVRLRANWNLTRRLSGFATVSYLDQSDEGELESAVDVPGDFDKFRFGIGVTYLFPPIRL